MHAAHAEALRREATRLYLRYAVEVVEGFQLCPWAAAARAAGRVHIEVLLFPHEAAEPLQAAAAAIEALAQDEQVDIGLLLLPQLDLDHVRFGHWVAKLRELHSAEHRVGQAPFALADFHPHPPFDAASPEKLVPYLRRTPDPTIQLVRMQRLVEVRRGQEQGTRLADPAHLQRLVAGDPTAWAPAPAPLHSRVIQANLRTLERLGADTVMAALNDIAADRQQSYAHLGPSPPDAKKNAL